MTIGKCGPVALFQDSDLNSRAGRRSGAVRGGRHGRTRRQSLRIESREAADTRSLAAPAGYIAVTDMFRSMKSLATSPSSVRVPARLRGVGVGGVGAIKNEVRAVNRFQRMLAAAQTQIAVPRCNLVHRFAGARLFPPPVLHGLLNGKPNVKPVHVALV